MNKQEMKICLWYDDQAEEAVRFYTSIFADSETGQVSRFGKEGFEHHGKPEGTAMAVEFSLNGMKFIALNGGPLFRFNESVSITVYCETQEEIDHYWSRLTEGGTEQPCGWLKDKYGLSWQIQPAVLPSLLTTVDPVRKERVLKALFRMTRFDLAKLQEAYDGK
ncbi:MAG: VOC family protein [Bacteroidota bacterium]